MTIDILWASSSLNDSVLWLVRVISEVKTVEVLREEMTEYKGSKESGGKVG